MGSKIYTKAERAKDVHIRQKQALAAPRRVAKKTALAANDEIEWHPMAAAFPSMRGAAFSAFLESIRNDGQIEPIVVLEEDGKRVGLDGRNRARACAELGIAPLVRLFGSRPGDGDDPERFIINENVHRRHLNETQRAMIASRLATLPVGGKSANLHSLTLEQAADIFGVARRTVAHARKAEEAIAATCPEFMPLLEDGELPASKISAICDRADFPTVAARTIERIASGKTPRKALKEVLADLVHGTTPVVEDEQATSGRGKPAWLMQALVRHYSRSGQLVCDPLAGYASTLRAARAEGRRAIGSEMDPAVAEAAHDQDLRVGRWEDALADVDLVDAIICDPPYSERTHAAATTRADDSSETGLTPTYAAWTPEDVHAFVAAWSPRCSGWFVALTDSELLPAWRDAFRAAGRYAFAPVPCVIKGMTVRISGDGPSSWCVYAMVARPSSEAHLKWGTLPGAYVGTKERELWTSEVANAG